MNRFAALLAVLAVSAYAADADPRGWASGTLAASAPLVLAGPAERPVLEFPKALAQRVTKPTVLLYFSPTCPHCRHVAAEIESLSRDLTAAGAQLIGISSGSATEAELLEFQATYGVTFLLIQDLDRAIQGAMGAQSTPSVMLVAPSSKNKLEVRDVWYPFHAGWSTLVLGRVTGDLWAQFRTDAYVGGNVCAACHTQEHGSWLLTLHSVAWRTLVLGSKDGDPACTRCHVTGAGQPNGGWSGEANSPMVDVSCEACHGPGGPHDGHPTEPATACAGCHDAQHSIAFSLQRALPLIDHYKVNTLSDGAFEQTRRALYAGEVGQDLLAFPVGKNVGSDKCIACHAAEYAWWAADPHASGMAQLAPKGSDDPACVRCHATARTSPPPAELEGFDRMGGVGCESCHGPGEAHVAAAGGKSNIQGLGESCPVCIIDAVCTSCHTPQWSPEWKLEDRLRAVHHGPATP